MIQRERGGREIQKEREGGEIQREREGEKERERMRRNVRGRERDGGLM